MMSHRLWKVGAALTLGLAALGSVSALSSAAQASNGGSVTITFGSYSTTQQVYQNQIFPAFEKYWKAKTGQTVKFNASFDSSGTESKAIASGLPVDVAVLSLADDINRIQQAGYITHDWTAGPYHGIVTDSIVAIGVRKGNPKHIHDWKDLTKKGVVVDLPNPDTSGGAKWDIAAIYGAGLKAGTEVTAEHLLGNILKNVQVLDKSGEASMSTFVSGEGDAVVGYEDDIIRNSNHLKTFSEVIPKDTLLIENPVALIDKNVDAHGNRKVAEAFVQFLYSPQAQKIFASDGFRPVNQTVWKSVKKNYTTPSGLFTVKYLGGWAKIDAKLFAPNAIFDQILATKQ
ncbi:MAG: sulfate ABC transporter substrate-binding protein [Alicyclobacillus sp.]|nr:sulfate ABC transporter substrate-binding protein [Alicyclobacillus sp.]